MYTNIVRNRPSNFILEDDHLFSRALFHIYKEPSIQIYRNCWWDVARSSPITRIAIFIRNVAAFILGYKKLDLFLH